MNTTNLPPTKGFAILIKAPNCKRTFIPHEGETITITDKAGKELWSFKNPQGQDNPGIIIYDVQVDILAEREFGNFAQKTWNRGPTENPPTPASPPTNPS